MKKIIEAVKRIVVGPSLYSRIKVSMNVLVLLMLVPAIISISLMMVFSTRYHMVIVHMDEVSSLMPLIRDDLLYEMSDIVVGRTRFEDGSQYAMIDDAEAELNQLIESDAASSDELVIVTKTLATLKKYVVRLGEQMAGDVATVDDNLALLDEIRDNARLVVEELQDSISAEIQAAAEQSDNMQHIVRLTLGFELGLLALTYIFALFAQRALSRSIREPMNNLERFAGQIASGGLSERAELPAVDELKDLTRSLNTMAENLEELMAANSREQENLKKSELRALQAQITPHFLYNTLDAIIWLAESKRYSEVIQITSALSNFYRTSLSNGKDWITIEQEKQHLEGYLTILKMRYRDILTYEIDIDDELLQTGILKLLIQPLIENAIYHGIKNRRGGGILRISIAAEGQRMRVSVRDNGAGMEMERLIAAYRALQNSEPMGSDSGYGLFSVDKRIKLYYNQLEGLQIDSVKGGGTVVSFTVPIKEMNYV